MLLFYYALFVLIFWFLVTVYLLYSRSRMQHLYKVPVTTIKAPAVVIIIAVRNEEANLQQALQSVTNLQYSNFRILVINDRSTDATATILKTFEEKYSHISVMHITHLPPGWLGKNHALYTGYQATTEEWMLFTDADVEFEPHTLQKATQYCITNKLDHLTVLPDVKSRSEWLNSMLATFLVLLEIRQRPWDVSNPKSKASLGIGAFNLVHRKAYEKAGTHTGIALRPDDDLKLGEKIKAAGCRQHAVYGKGQIGLEWYTSVKEFINGLMKNTFSVFDYNLLNVVVKGVLPLLLLLILPLPILLLFGDVLEKWIAIVVLTLQVILFTVKGGMRTQWWYALMLPVAGSLLVYIFIKAAFITMRQGGIYWRESFYPLSELKKGAKHKKK